MPLVLEVVSGASGGLRVTLTSGQTLEVGRAGLGHAALAPDAEMDDRHFSLSLTAHECRLRDLGSRQGTLVNGQVLREGIVRPGDRIQAGRTSFVLRVLSEASGDISIEPPGLPEGVPEPLEFPEFSEELQDLHAEELGFLWGQRRSFLFSPIQKLYDLQALEGRLEGHLQGLLLAGASRVAVHTEALKAKDAGRVAAAGLVLLCVGKPEPVLAALTNAEGEARDGLRDALCHTPKAEGLVRPLLTSAEAATTALAAEVVAFHNPESLTSGISSLWLGHESPLVRRSAWRAVRYGALAPSGGFLPGWRDTDPEVQREALQAAAWARNPELLPFCRTQSPGQNPRETATMLAILGEPTDLSQLLRLVDTHQGETWPLTILGRLGHPGGVDTLLGTMSDPNPRRAVAAGLAFTHLTGIDVASQQLVRLPPEDGSPPDAFASAFLDEDLLPDPDKARSAWGRVRSVFTGSTRWSRGCDVIRGAPHEIRPRLDLQAWADVCLRGLRTGTWKGRARDLELFPSR